MVKAILSTPIGRKITATTMLATAVLSTNAANLKVENTNSNYNQTELISQEAATALKNQVLKEPTNIVEHNKKMNKLLLATCENNKETKKMKSNLDAIYRVYGPYASMIELQRTLDDHYIEETFNSYLEYYNLTKYDCDIAKQIISHFHGWKDNVYYTELFKDELKMYEKSSIPNAEECLATIDNHINNKEFFKDDDIEIYHEFSKIFKAKQTDKDSPQAKADLIAYKVHLLNALAFNNYFTVDYKIPKPNVFAVSFGYDFVNGIGVVKP